MKGVLRALQSQHLLKRGLAAPSSAEAASLAKQAALSENAEQGTSSSSLLTEGVPGDPGPAGRVQSAQPEMVAAFTCNKCGARTARGFSKSAYDNGVVVVKCGDCQAQHLLSDKLGWFGEKGNVEDFLRDKGQTIRKHTDGTINITEEDLRGWSKGDPDADDSKR